MKLFIAISAVLAGLVSSDDQVATELGTDFITKLFKLYQADDTEGLNKIYDDNFKHTSCEASINKADIINHYRSQVGNLNFDFIVDEALVNGDELRFILSSAFGSDKVESIEYKLKKNKEGEYVIMPNRNANCDKES